MVRPERMAENIERGLGLHASSRLLTALIDAGLARAEAYAIVQRNALRAADERTAFRDLVEADPEVSATLRRGAAGALFRRPCRSDPRRRSHRPAGAPRSSDRRPAAHGRCSRSPTSVGLVDLARGLAERGFELVSTGGTARTIREAGIEVIDVATVTGAPEMLDGRVKTLHPRIHGGVLANLHDPAHRAQLAEQGIEPFSLVVVNLYQFEQAARQPGTSDEDLIEEIDIGGPTLVRAAAKNHASVAIVTEPDDYPAILAEIDEHGVHPARITRAQLALKAFRRTAAYDAAITAELTKRWAPDDRLPETLPHALRRRSSCATVRTPTRQAALYSIVGADPAAGPFVEGATPLQGKPLSYNNLLDASAVAAMARDLEGDAVVIVKHGNPCGAAEADDLLSAWERALADRSGECLRRVSWPSTAESTGELAHRS